MSTTVMARPRHWTGADATSTWLDLVAELAPDLAAHAAELDRSGAFVADAFAQIKPSGLLAMLVPRDLGGGGATHADAGAVLAAMARACPATSLALSMHTHLVAFQVWRHRHGQAAPVLGRVAAEHLALISTGASDWLASNGTVRRVDGGYRVTAHKTPASACPAGDLLVTTGRWDDAPDGPLVLHFAVPFRADGVSIIETWDTMGMRATGSHTVVLDDVFVPDAAIAMTRPPDLWHPAYSAIVGAALPLILCSYVGVAEEAAARAQTLAARRLDRPEVVSLVGRMNTRLTCARDTVRAMFDASDDLAFDNTLEFAAAQFARRTTVADAVLDVVRLALEVGGGAAFSAGSGIERLFRDAHGVLYHPLPAAQQERFSGRVLLGLDPSG